MLPGFAHTRPSTLAEAVERLSAPGARAHAGGTDLLGCLRDRVLAADTVVSLSALTELRGISTTADGGVRIGALATVAEVAAEPAITRHYPALADAAQAVASPQLRNQGTIGGNLCQRPRCWYFRGDFHCARKGGDVCYAVEGENQYHAILGGEVCFIVHPSDTAPALIAYDAIARIAGPGGSRAVPLETFFVPPSTDFTRETILEPGEILTELLLPPPAEGQRGTYRKARIRAAWDFALAGVAANLAVRDRRVRSARVVLSGVAPVPWRVPEAERILAGARIDARTARDAGLAAVKGAAPLGNNGYKVDLVRGIVEEALLALA
ncbi:MAG: FAD binding domain-containing protein [Acidobacteriota bacterium]